MSRKFDTDFAYVVTCDYELTRLLSRRAYTREEALKILVDGSYEISPDELIEGWVTFQFSQAFDGGTGWIYTCAEEKPYPNSQPVWILLA